MHRYYALITLIIYFPSYAMYFTTLTTQEKFIQCADKGDISYVLDAIDRDKTLLCVQDCAGRTVLHRALLRNNQSIALLLIQAVQDRYKDRAQGNFSDYPLNIQDFEGNTPLHIAFEKNYTQLIQELCTAKADITLANNNNITAAELLVQQHEQQNLQAKSMCTLSTHTALEEPTENYQETLEHQCIKQSLSYGSNNNNNNRAPQGQMSLIKLLASNPALLEKNRHDHPSSVTASTASLAALVNTDLHTIRQLSQTLSAQEYIQQYTRLLEHAQHNPSRELLLEAIEYNFVSIVKIVLNADIPILQEDIDYARKHQGYGIVQLLLNKTNSI